MNNKNAAAPPPISQEYKGGYKLEIGKHTFRDRIQDNCIYVDKTQYIYELMSRESNCFLSRPRRFGKSLLISTFKELFSGSKELFKNCWIYDKIDWQEYPIIHLDFLDVDYKNLGLEPAIDDALNSLADRFNIELHKKSIKGKFGEFIEILAKDKKVVVLVDEYDKPIIDYLNNIPQAEENRDILKNFYSTLKAQTHHIKFLLLTGVSKFSRVSIFSDLNHLKDITIHPRYAKMLGYTQEEIEHCFSYYIDEWEKQSGEKREVLFEKLKDYYNGYSWDGINFVYNPFSILSFFDTYRFNNYWFATGSPTFLVNILKKTDISIDQYECMSVSGNFFEKFDIGTIGSDNISSLLFQTGYLTIKEIKDQVYILSYPNREVKTAFLQYLLEGFSNKPEYETNEITSGIKQALAENKIDDFIQSLKTLLSSIPYNIHIENREAYYHSLIYLALKVSMMDVQAEIQTALGRSDIVVSMDRYIYIIEFKRGSAQSALDQIEEKQYYSPYLGKNKQVILLGIGLDETERNIGEWIAREIGGETRMGITKEPNEEKRELASQPTMINQQYLTAGQYQQNRQEVAAHVEVDVEVNLELSVDLPALQADFDDLKELLIQLNPGLKEKLTELGEGLDQLSPKSKPAELNGPMNKLGRFLKKLGDEKSDLSKILGGAKKGVEILQKVGKTYNKIAQWLALPQVPELLLKKI